MGLIHEKVQLFLKKQHPSTSKGSDDKDQFEAKEVPSEELGGGAVSTPPGDKTSLTSEVKVRLVIEVQPMILTP